MGGKSTSGGLLLVFDDGGEGICSGAAAQSSPGAKALRLTRYGRSRSDLDGHFGHALRPVHFLLVKEANAALGVDEPDFLGAGFSVEGSLVHLLGGIRFTEDLHADFGRNRRRVARLLHRPPSFRADPRDIRALHAAWGGDRELGRCRAVRRMPTEQLLNRVLQERVPVGVRAQNDLALIVRFDFVRQILRRSVADDGRPALLLTGCRRWYNSRRCLCGIQKMNGPFIRKIYGVYGRPKKRSVVLFASTL